MHGRRAFAAAAAAGLLVSLFAPWYRETVVAPGLHGLRTLTLTQSGWQAFSATELVILAVAVLTLLAAITMPAGVPEDGAPDRLRLFGVVVAVLGAIAFVVVLARLTTAPGTTKHTLAETMVAIRWGIFLALVCCAALTAAGLRLIRASQRTATPVKRSGRAARASRRERAPRSAREPRPGPTARQDRAARPDRARPEAAHSNGMVPSPAAPEPRSERTRPTRRTDRPLWVCPTERAHGPRRTSPSYPDAGRM
jgi:MFS family permease